MRSQKNILIKKTVNPITIGNESIISKGYKNMSTLNSICVEGSHMRASGSAPDLQALGRKSISPEDYQQLKKIPNEKRAELASNLWVFKNLESAKSLNKLKLQPLTTTNSRQNQQIPSLQLPLTSLPKKVIDIEQTINKQQQHRQLSTKKLKPLRSAEYSVNMQQQNEVIEEKEEIPKNVKKVKKKKDGLNTRGSQVMTKRIYSPREALVEILKIIQELEIIVEGDISSQDLIRIIDNLMRSREEAKREMLICRKDESFNMIYEKIYPKVMEAVSHLEFSHQYQYINKKFIEVLNQTSYVTKEQNQNVLENKTLQNQNEQIY